ncbi:MAG TPA: imidazole glycerol phosphate synthase subunit HisH [Acidimicrobiales bacterium]|nr:imidazole glycerol phosphate synthase subunit HisH [Acidimicrobiales bacterium]
MTAAPRIAVLDYGIGNLRSAEKALQHVGADARLVTEAAEVAAADAVVLPGVGAFGACARALRESGLEGPARAALDDGVPFFGVCVGFQLLYEGSVESPGAEGLGVFGGKVAALPPGVKHPQMQWNQLEVTGGAGEAEPTALRGLGPRPWVYFVHSFAPPVGDETVAVCDYGGPVAALVGRGPLWGAQFHPEKSGSTGLRLLSNFVDLAAAA